MPDVSREEGAAPSPRSPFAFQAAAQQLWAAGRPWDAGPTNSPQWLALGHLQLRDPGPRGAVFSIRGATVQIKQNGI